MSGVSDPFLQVSTTGVLTLLLGPLAAAVCKDSPMGIQPKGESRGATLS